MTYLPLAILDFGSEGWEGGGWEMEVGKVEVVITASGEGGL